MKQILDTNSFIWFVGGDSKISGMRHQIESNENLLSKASIWEMAIKYSIGKLSLSLPLNEFIKQQVKPNGIRLLSININHINVVATLPLHHRDPLDRLLIAQAMVEQIPIISNDSAFDAYQIQRLS